MAELDDLTWRTLAEVEAAARAFLDPILGGSGVRRWDPASWGWK